MSFKEKVQKVVIEMTTPEGMKEIKETLIKQISQELLERHERVIMKSLDEWKERTLKVAVKEVLQEIQAKNESD